MEDSSMIRRMTGAVAGLVLLLAYAYGAGGAGAGQPQKRLDAPVHEIADLKMTLIRVEPGEFPADEAGRDEHELQHKVRLTKPFYLQATEVSQAQFKAIIAGEHPSEFKGDDLPVESVSWHAAVLFCELLSKREGRTFRLPSEAEWEYAARAGAIGPVSGTGKLAEMAWHADNSGKQPLDSAAICGHRSRELLRAPPRQRLPPASDRRRHRQRVGLPRHAGQRRRVGR
jgi:formylglycine-generating enzyme required for sulfatase activity